MKIGIYGGTFNPIHRGHLTAARAAMDALGLDRLLLIPASVPPHKALPQGSADAADRLEMAALACAELGPVAQALDIELHRTGPSYTVDTLRQLRMEDHLQQKVAELFLEILRPARLPQDIDPPSTSAASSMQAGFRLSCVCAPSQGHPPGPLSCATISQSRPTDANRFFSSSIRVFPFILPF